MNLRLRSLLLLPLLIGALPVCAEDQDVATLYYAKLARHRAAEKAVGSPAPIASGVVRNSLDEPVAGATVIVIRSRYVNNQTKFDELAKGVTDESGRFAIAAKTRKKDPIGLEIHPPAGYMMWRRWEGGTVEGESIVLNRVIDDAYFADVDHEGDPVRRSLLVLDLVGRRAFNSYHFNELLEQYYSHLGEIREDLLAIAQSKAFAVVDDDYNASPAQRAKNLLIYWFDPRDESLIRQWAKEEAFKNHRLETKFTGISPEEALTAYVKDHFDGEPKTFYYFTSARFSPDCKHLYVVFCVRYANWAYWLPLALTEEGGRWAVKLTGPWGHWHSLPPDGPARPYPDLL